MECVQRSDRSSDSLSNEDFVKDVDRLLSETPIPPMNQSASGTFARVVDVPPILLCESNTVYFYEESVSPLSSHIGFSMGSSRWTVS